MSHSRMRRRTLVLGAAGLALGLGAAGSCEPLSRRFRAAQLLRRLAAAHGPGRQAQPSAALFEREVFIPGPTGPIRARLYARSEKSRGRGLVIAHGVHHRGIDEARLVPFARSLAESGRIVLTPELHDLTEYAITEQGVGVIVRAATWLSERAEVVSDRIGVLGFSFAGGLALVAAARPELREKLEFVTSVGGHHDLGRVLRFLVTNQIETPSGVRHTPAHDYGLLVLLNQHLGRFVEPVDLPVMADALRFWLREDRQSALQRASLRTTAGAERLYTLLEKQRLRELRDELTRAIVRDEAKLRALSPRGKLRELGVPVYLLHGASDNVIPPSETDWAARELEGKPHRALVSPLIDHVEVSQSAGISDELELVEFMARLL